MYFYFEEKKGNGKKMFHEILLFCKSWEMKCISRIVPTGITCLKDMLLSVKNTREKFTSKVKTKIVMFRLVVKFTRYFTQCHYLIAFILVSVGKFSLLLSICFLCLSILFFNGIFFLSVFISSGGIIWL